MKIKKIESGIYESEDGVFRIEKDYTLMKSGRIRSSMRLVTCYVIYKSGCRWSTCHTLEEAKTEVKCYYA